MIVTTTVWNLQLTSNMADEHLIPKRPTLWSNNEEQKFKLYCRKSLIVHVIRIKRLKYGELGLNYSLIRTS